MRSILSLALVSVFCAALLSGCAAALIGGGAVAGYAVAKDMNAGSSTTKK